MSLRAIELSPSADIHLSVTAPHNSVAIAVWVYDDTAPPAVAPDASLTYVLPGHTGAPGDPVLTDGFVSFDRAARLISAVGTGHSYLQVECVVDGRTYYQSVRISVHEQFQSFWIGNNSGAVNRDSDNFVVSVFAETNKKVAVDVTGHGFVTLAAAGGTVDPQTGRVDGHGRSVGDVITVSATENGNTAPPFSTRVKVRDAIGAERRIVEPLFSRGDKPGRRNILFLAEGFTADEKYLFLQFARKIAHRLTRRRAHEPFRMLREDYRIWTAFEPSEESGVTVCARVDDTTGNLGSNVPPNQNLRLLQARNSAFGLSYGNRSGEIRFGTQPQPMTDQHWYAQAVDGDHFAKDWRRMSSDHGKWQQEALAWLASLRTVKGPEYNASYEIGTRWGLDGADQGLVLVLVNDQRLAANYNRGDWHPGEGFLWAAANNRTLITFTFTSTTNTASRDHVPGEQMFEPGENPFLAPRIVEYRAMHELAHAFFLGDEYGGEDPTGRPTADVRRHDNVDEKAWIDAQPTPETKWSRVRRVVKASRLSVDAKVLTAERITLNLPTGEGEKWPPPGPTELYLRTRNINFASGTTKQVHGSPHPYHSFFPEYRNHPPLERKGLRVESRTGDTLVVTGAELEVDDEFPAGSTLFEPHSLTLVLPGVVASMGGSATPLHSRAGACASQDLTVTVYPVAGIPNIIEPEARERLIGLYEEGGGFNCQVYRPSGQCMMRNQYEAVSDPASGAISDIVQLPFCHVCRYTIVSEIEPAKHPVLDEQYPGSIV